MFIFTYNPVGASVYKKTFKDVSMKNVNYDIIHTMADRGIIGGYEDGTGLESILILNMQLF